VPYVPTPPEVVEEMLRMAQVTRQDVLYDLGCGDGRIVITAAQKYGTPGTGVDIDPQRILEANLNARQAGVAQRVRFLQQDLFETKFRDATVVTLYLLPKVNLRLRPTLLQDLRPGTRVVSHAFDMDDWLPDRTTTVGSNTLYFWVVPAQVAGVWTWGQGGTSAQPYALRLSQHYQQINGLLQAGGVDIPLTALTLVGDRLRFSAMPQGQRVVFDGRVEGNTITGQVATDSPTAGSPQSWSAQRTASAQ
jgi:SAM-dependent methyltransferase